MTEQMPIEQLIEATKGGYSYNAYTPSGWANAIKKLRKRGWDDQTINGFMLSKHTRWARDFDEKRSWGKHNSGTIMDYIERYRGDIDAEARQMGLETGPVDPNYSWCR